jgi:cytochrome P450 family 6
MFPIIKNCGQGLEDYLVTNFNNGVDVFEFRDLLARFSTNIISSVAFGIENDCINEPDHIFRKMGAKFFEPNFKNGIRGMIQLLIPSMFYKLKQKSLDDDIEEFMFSIVKQTVEYREQKNFSRNDFMQLLIQLKNQGYVSVDSKIESAKIESEATKLTIGELAAQCFVFFIAGKTKIAIKPPKQLKCECFASL